MNVIVDTNVWISAFIGKDGASHEVIRWALLDKITPQISTTLFLEYEDVMKREKIQIIKRYKKLTLRIPDSKYERLKSYAKSKEISLNKLFDELATIALTQYDAKTRFDVMVSKANRARGLELLKKLDNA